MSFVRGFRRCLSSSTVLSSSYSAHPRKTLTDIANKYREGVPISMVTSHDFLTSRMCEKAGVDIALIGDSLAMTTLGYDDTIELPFDEFLYHVRSVQRGNRTSLLIADLPFGSFESSTEQAVQSVTQLIKLGKIQGVKIEGGNDSILPTIKRVVQMGIPVMGHVGLTPQHHNSLGGFKLQGNTIETATQIFNECIQLQKAGVFSIVLECVPNKLAQYITESLTIPTIGIGAGPDTSGQVLVVADMLGMCDPETSHLAKFVKQYDSFFKKGVDAIKQYNDDLVSKKFPLPDEHGYKMKKSVLEGLKEKTKK